VPLGAGSSVASELFYGHRELLILTAGWLIIALGVAQAVGGGFALGPAVRLQQRFAGRGGSASVFGLGAVYGLAGFCSGPILGAVLTVAAAGGQPLRGAALLAVYALGMTAPLFVLALLWDRFRLGQRRWLRGSAFRLGPLHLHSTMVISGLLFVGVGVLFLRYDGTAGITGALGMGDTTGVDTAAQEWIAKLQVPDWALLVGLVIVILGVTAWRLQRLASQAHKHTRNEESRDRG
jgi:cytochrome c biogenesis protein CcdA